MDSDKLLAALDAARDDAERLALLNAVPRKVREELAAELCYRKFIADTAAAVAAERAALAAFSRELDEAPDDSARLRVIATAQADPGRGPAFVTEWSWQRNATEDDWRRRYLAAANGTELPDASEL
jgi:hypothetical protein